VEYPPTLTVTPKPYSCENCHWEQGIILNSDTSPDPWIPGDGPPSGTLNAGHPSTYDHYDAWGNFVGYFEYGHYDLSSPGTPILGNFDNHHMGFRGNVSANCYKCHANDPNDPSWDPYQLDLIRYCELCHDKATLHTIPEHVGPPGTDGGPAAEGWEAIGFHASGGGDQPTVYVGDNSGAGDGFSGKAHNDPAWAGNLTGYFEANEMCFGCHGDNVPDYVGDLASAPTVDAFTPISGCPGAYLEISGSDFGDQQTPERQVQLKDGMWVTIPVVSWTDSLVIAEIPGWTFPPGSYKVRVKTEGGGAGVTAGTAKFTIVDCSSAKVITPDSGPCEGTITLSSGTGKFGLDRDTLSAASAADGIFRTITLVSSQGTYVAAYDDGGTSVIANPSDGDYITKNWGNVAVKFKLEKGGWFQDTNTFAELGGNGNFVRDDGSDPDLPAEAQFDACSAFNVGPWAVYIKYVFYEDVNGSGGYDAGDEWPAGHPNNPTGKDDDGATPIPAIFQVETSNPVIYDLTNRPGINRANPKKFARGDRVKLIGINFGPVQGDGKVFMGKKNQYIGTSLTAVAKFGNIYDGQPTGGKEQLTIKNWSNTKVVIKAKPLNTWKNTARYIWIQKNGSVSNATKVKLLTW
jgi:hypothetical protein